MRLPDAPYVGLHRNFRISFQLRWRGPADAPRTGPDQSGPWSNQQLRRLRGRRSCPWSAPAGPAGRPTARPAERGPSSRQARCRHGHEPPHVEPEVKEAADQLAHVGRVVPVAAGQARRVDLHQDPCPRGKAGDPRSLGLPGHALPQTDERCQQRDLVSLHGSEEVPDDCVVCRGCLCDELCRIVLAQVTEPGFPRRRGTASGPKPFVTPTTRTRAGSPPARSIRCRTASSLRATSSLAEEGGDVEIVVTQVELVLGPRGVGKDVHRLGCGEDRRREVG